MEPQMITDGFITFRRDKKIVKIPYDQVDSREISWQGKRGKMTGLGFIIKPGKPMPTPDQPPTNQEIPQSKKDK